MTKRSREEQKRETHPWEPEKHIPVRLLINLRLDPRAWFDEDRGSNEDMAKAMAGFGADLCLLMKWYQWSSVEAICRVGDAIAAAKREGRAHSIQEVDLGSIGAGLDDLAVDLSYAISTWFRSEYVVLDPATNDGAISLGIGIWSVLREKLDQIVDAAMQVAVEDLFPKIIEDGTPADEME